MSTPVSISEVRDERTDELVGHMLFARSPESGRDYTLECCFVPVDS